MIVVNESQDFLQLFLRGTGFLSAFIFKKSATLSVAEQIFIGRMNRASQGVRSDGNHREHH